MKITWIIGRPATGNTVTNNYGQYTFVLKNSNDNIVKEDRHSKKLKSAVVATKHSITRTMFDDFNRN